MSSPRGFSVSGTTRHLAVGGVLVFHGTWYWECLHQKAEATAAHPHELAWAGRSPDPVAHLPKPVLTLLTDSVFMLFLNVYLLYLCRLAGYQPLRAHRNSVGLL